MKSRQVCWCLFVGLVFLGPMVYAEKTGDTVVSVNFSNISISEAMNELARTAGIKIVIKEEPLQDIVTKSYINKTIDQIITDMLINVNHALVWTYKGTGLESINIWVSDRSGDEGAKGYPKLANAPIASTSTVETPIAPQPQPTARPILQERPPGSTAPVRSAPSISSEEMEKIINEGQPGKKGDPSPTASEGSRSSGRSPSTTSRTTTSSVDSPSLTPRPKTSAGDSPSGTPDIPTSPGGPQPISSSGRGPAITTFLMPIEAVSGVTSSAIAAPGEIEVGSIHTGDEVDIVGLRESSTRSRVIGINISGKMVEQATVGDNVALQLSGISATDIQPGMVIAAPNTIQAHKKLEAIFFILNEDKAAFNDALAHGSPQEFHFRTAVVTGVFTLKKGTKVEFPGGLGGYAQVSVDLSLPVAMEGGLMFTMGADGKTTGQVIGFPK